MQLEEFKKFVESGVTTQAGFGIDVSSLVYNLDSDNKLVSVRGVVKSVDPKYFNAGLSLLRTKTPPQDVTVIWDANGKPINTYAVLALCKVAA